MSKEFKELVMLVSMGLFFWSVWAFYKGQHALAYYLIGAAIYVAAVFMLGFFDLFDTRLENLEQISKYK